MSSKKMEYKYLGNSGLRVSVLSIGAWLTWGSDVGDETAFECIKAAYDAGCNFFDNAEAYAGGKAEEVMGRCIKKLDVPRSEIVVSTKVFWGGKGINQTGLSRKHIIEGVNDSLKRLQLDYVDLVFCHRPDIFTPIEETVRAMNFLINQGKALYWGTSEWTAMQIMQAYQISERLGLISPIMEQPQYNMFHRSRVELEYLPLYREMKLGTTIWSPLASGLLTGKYTLQEWSNKKFSPDKRLGKENSAFFTNAMLEGKGLNGIEEKDIGILLKKVDELKKIAESIGCSVAQLALSWCLKNPNVTTVITGASNVSQVIENFGSLEIVSKISPQIMEKIEDILQNKPQG